MEVALIILSLLLVGLSLYTLRLQRKITRIAQTMASYEGLASQYKTAYVAQNGHGLRYEWAIPNSGKKSA